MERVTLAGLLKLELPERTVLLCDGGFVGWGADTFLSADPVFGTVGGFDQISEGTGDEAPAGTVQFYPADLAAAVALSKPGHQGSRLRIWIAEIDETSGLVIGAPDLIVDWITDRTILKRESGLRVLEMACVTGSQRLLAKSDGNVLSTPAHQRTWPGEQGFDNATGLAAQFAWGIAAQPRGTTSATY